MNQNAVIYIFFFCSQWRRQPWWCGSRTPAPWGHRQWQLGQWHPPSTLCPEDEEDLASYLTKTELFNYYYQITYWQWCVLYSTANVVLHSAFKFNKMKLNYHTCYTFFFSFTLYISVCSMHTFVFSVYFV